MNKYITFKLLEIKKYLEETPEDADDRTLNESINKAIVDLEDLIDEIGEGE